jgi:hypothetical protein
MTYSADFRWRAVSLMHIYGIPVDYISDLFGPKPRTLHRWYALFLAKGVVYERAAAAKSSRWPENVVADVRTYIAHHPTFYLEELQTYIEQKFPDLKNTSLSTICRALQFDMGLTRKILTRAARESVPEEVHPLQCFQMCAQTDCVIPLGFEL